MHRAIDAVIAGRKPAAEGLWQLGNDCSALERRAETAERELVKLKLLLFLSSRVGEEMAAVVTSVEPFGLFAQGIELPAEGLLPIAALPDDVYRYDRGSHTLTGRRAESGFRLGDRLQVAVARVDLERRELEFRLVDRGRRRGGGVRARQPGRRPPQPRGRRPGAHRRGRR